MKGGNAVTAEDVDEKRRRKKASKSSNVSSSSSPFPSALVWDASTGPPGALEWGVLLLVCIVGLYLYGFYISVYALPDVPGMPNFSAHMGRNLNVANPHEWDLADDDDDDDNVSGDASSNSDKNKNKKPAGNVNPLNPAGASGVAASLVEVRVPRGIWPVSLRNEDKTNWETIIHPGDQETKMIVPPFWSKPLHHKTQFPRQVAMKVGTCIEPDPQTGSFQRGDACPLHQRTIYVGIASYRDFQCRATAESIFLRAKYPERIRIGVVDQIVEGEDPVCDAPMEACHDNPGQGLCKFQDQIDVYTMDAPLSIGPVFARHIGYRLYRGEYYATQSDAHVSYTQDWDVDIISQLEATHNEMAVLTTYLTDVQGSIDPAGNSKRHTRPIMCNTVYEGGAQGMHLRHASQPERDPSIHGMPQLQPWWAAGYSFSRGHFIVNVPYDWLQPMIFQGEEMSIGIRGFTIGYDYYAPERSVCFHHYAVGANAKTRNKVPHFWENDRKYAGTGRRAMQRLLGFVHMNPEVDPSQWDHSEEDMYGIGGVRTAEKFYETFGIDVVKKTVQRHLCSFVDLDGKMHKTFMPYLRSDGMGIDYSKINYKFVDPRPGEK